MPRTVPQAPSAGAALLPTSPAAANGGGDVPAPSEQDVSAMIQREIDSALAMPKLSEDVPPSSGSISPDAEWAEMARLLGTSPDDAAEMAMDELLSATSGVATPSAPPRDDPKAASFSGEMEKLLQQLQIDTDSVPPLLPGPEPDPEPEPEPPSTVPNPETNTPLQPMAPAPASPRPPPQQKTPPPQQRSPQALSPRQLSPRQQQEDQRVQHGASDAAAAVSELESKLKSAEEETRTIVAFMEEDLTALREELDSEKAARAELLQLVGEYEARAEKAESEAASLRNELDSGGGAAAAAQRASSELESKPEQQQLLQLQPVQHQAGQTTSVESSLAEEMDRRGLTESDRERLMEEGVTTVAIFRLLEEEDFAACGIDIAARGATRAAEEKAKNRQDAAAAAAAQDAADKEAMQRLLQSEAGQLSDAGQAAVGAGSTGLSELCRMRVGEMKAALGLSIADARVLCNVLGRSPYVEEFKFRLVDRRLLQVSERRR